jgi:hypothetical protein
MSMTTVVYAPAEGEAERILKDPAFAGSFFSVENRAIPILDLDKSWHGLHYLLTQSSWEGEGPQAFLIHGGELIDLGMASARVFFPAQVKPIDAALAGMTTDEFRSRFNPHLMMTDEVYPEIWDRDPKDDDTLGWLVSSFEELKKFVRQAQSESRCLVIMNEWPAGEKAAASAIPERKGTRLPHIIAVAVCTSVVAAYYAIKGRSTWPFLVEAAVLYMVAALFVGAPEYLLALFVPKQKRSKSTWATGLAATMDSAGIQGAILLLLFIAAKLFGVL